MRETIRLTGVGVHRGESAFAAVHPGADGLRFLVDGAVIPADIAYVQAYAGATVLSTHGVSVGMVEHLLAALLGRGITDADIVASPELPILDGSALPWWEALTPSAPIGTVVPYVVALPVGHDGAWFTPNPLSIVEVAVDYGPTGPQGQAHVVLDGADFARIAPARTFALGRDIDALLAAGRGRGATLQNTVIWDDTGPRQPLRSPLEPVEHKLLDAVGDLALFGRPIVGRFRVERGSHARHHAAIRALRAASQPPR